MASAESKAPLDRPFGQTGRTVAEQIVRANGVELCAEAFGAAADPALLLVHGAGNSMLSWDEALCARLADGGRFVIRYDQRDAGRSVTSEAGAPGYTERDLLADATGLLDAFGVGRAAVMGLSGGAATAQLLALEHPDRVAALVLMASTPGIPGEDGDELPGPAEGLLAREPDKPDWGDREAVIEYLVEAERPYCARTREYDEAAMRALAERVVDRAASVEPMVTNPYLVEVGASWRARLGSIAVPTLVIHGTEDPLFPFPHGEALAREIPGAELLALERMGHEYPPRETWDVVVPAILRRTAP
jgi:pimeloyl-ACP methyl ester carboxylesterase